MKKARFLSVTVGLLLVLSLWARPTRAQFGMLGYGEMVREGLFNAGIGLTNIDGENYFTITMHPELAVGKFGIGLNVYLLFNTETGKIRSKDWNEGYDYFRMIRYIRYGWKGDKFYTRVGTLDAARLGHGFIMNYYTNEANWDERKIGLELDADFGTFGFESMTSNLGRLEIIGGRFYWRPFRMAMNVPILKNFAVGATYVSDTDPDKNRNTKGDAVTAYGADMELPLISTRIFWTGIYGDYAKIKNYGSGSAVGIGLQFKNLMGILQLEARLERRWLGKEFLPGLFNALYEIDRYVPAGNGTGVYKTDQLLGIQEDTRGIFGELYGKVLGIVQLLGSFQRLDDHPKSGVLHLMASATQGLPGIAFQATYDKAEIETFKDIRTLDNRSVARVSVGYKIKPYLILYMDYIWNFVLDEETGRYKPQERYSPRLAFNYNFSL